MLKQLVHPVTTVTDKVKWPEVMSEPISSRSITYHPPQYTPTTHGPAGRKSHFSSPPFKFVPCSKTRQRGLKTVWMKMWAGTAQLVERLATGSMVRGSNPGAGVELFRTFPDWPWGQPGLLYVVQCVPSPFPGGKAAGVRRWPPTSIYRQG